MLGNQARAVIDALIPSNANPTLKAGAFDAGFEAFYEDFTRTAILPMRLGFRAALLVAIWVSPLLIFRPPPFGRLSRDQRERALTALGRSRFYLMRQMLLLLKAITAFSYGADQGVRDALGFPLQFDDPRSKAEIHQ